MHPAAGAVALGDRKVCIPRALNGTCQPNPASATRSRWAQCHLETDLCPSCKRFLAVCLASPLTPRSKPNGLNASLKDGTDASPDMGRTRHVMVYDHRFLSLSAGLLLGFFLGFAAYGELQVYTPCRMLSLMRIISLCSNNNTHNTNATNNTNSKNSKNENKNKNNRVPLHIKIFCHHLCRIAFTVPLRRGGSTVIGSVAGIGKSTHSNSSACKH